VGIVYKKIDAPSAHCDPPVTPRVLHCGKMVLKRSCEYLWERAAATLPVLMSAAGWPTGQGVTSITIVTAKLRTVVVSCPRIPPTVNSRCIPTCVCVCVVCFIIPILGNRYGPGVNSLRQYTWGGRILTLHLNYVADYTGPLLFLFERTQ